MSHTLACLSATVAPFFFLFACWTYNRPVTASPAGVSEAIMARQQPAVHAMLQSGTRGLGEPTTPTPTPDTPPILPIQSRAPERAATPS